MPTKCKAQSIIHKALIFSSLALAIMNSSAYAAGFQVGDFTESEWQQTILEQDVSSAVLSIQNQGGHPGQYWQADYTLPTTESPGTTIVRIANIYNIFNYDPSVQGALKNIDFSIDLRGFNSNIADVTGYYRPAILQGGLVYSPDSSFKQVDVGNWATEHFHYDDSTKWTTFNGQLSPGFDASGGILYFGYIFALRTTCSSSAGCFSAATTSGLDNYTVNLSTVPEPDTYAMLLGGLGLFTAFRRERIQLITESKGVTHA